MLTNFYNFIINCLEFSLLTSNGSLFLREKWNTSEWAVCNEKKLIHLHLPSLPVRAQEWRLSNTTGMKADPFFDKGH